MANMKRRTGLTALALATGTAVLLSPTGANAQAVKVPDLFGGTAKAAAIHIEINLPIALPGIGNRIVQDISLTEGLTDFSGVTDMLAEGKSVLGEGNIPVVSDILGLEVLTSLEGLLSDAKNVVKVDDLLGLIDLGVGEITSSVTPEKGAQSVLSSASMSKLLSLEIGMSALTSALPALKGDLLGSVTGGTDGVVGTVTGAVDTLLGVVQNTPVGSAAPAVDNLVDTAQGLLDSLQSVIGNLGADDALLAVNLIQSSNRILRQGEAVTSEAFASIGGQTEPAISVLGGLVEIDALKTRSFSTAGGVKGSAAADTTTDIINAHVGDLLSLALTSEGLTGTLAGVPLPIQDAFNTVIDAVNTVLDVAGVKILTGKKTSNVDPNGQFASSSSEGVGIQVAPPVITDLLGGKPLVLVQMVPAGTAVNAARVAKPTVVAPPARPLPRTGVELPLFAALGTGIAGLALVARRRRAEEL